MLLDFIIPFPKEGRELTFEMRNKYAEIKMWVTDLCKPLTMYVYV